MDAAAVLQVVEGWSASWVLRSFPLTASGTVSQRTMMQMADDLRARVVRLGAKVGSVSAEDGWARLTSWTPRPPGHDEDSLEIRYDPTTRSMALCGALAGVGFGNESGADTDDDDPMHWDHGQLLREVRRLRLEKATLMAAAETLLDPAAGETERRRMRALLDELAEEDPPPSSTAI